MDGLLMEGVKAVLTDDTFSLSSGPAACARKVAECTSTWICDHIAAANTFQKKLIETLMKCMQVQHSSQKMRRERMWSAYHELRTSKQYVTDWKTFLQQAGNAELSPIFCQYVGHFIFKKLIQIHHPLDESPQPEREESHFTYEETNAIRYAAGWVARALKKKLTKSTHPLKDDLQLCLWDLLDDGDEGSNESKEWIELVDRGGLSRVNNITFELFLAMEKHLRKLIQISCVPFLSTDVTHAIMCDDDVQFLWCIISADWEDASSHALLEMVVSQWVKIRGFSYASAWVERFKASQRKTIQKSKGVRKQLMPMPNAKRVKVDHLQKDSN